MDRIGIRGRVVASGAVVLLAMASVAAGCEPAPPAGCAQAGLATTVRYATADGVPADLQSLDVYAPKGVCKAPVVMWVHGGGYAIGDKKNAIAAKKALFNGKGWILVSVNYRLTDGSATSARFPDHYEDVAAAVQWVNRNISKYGGTSAKVALLGHSAGADIVSNVAAQPSYLADIGVNPAIIDCLAPLDTEGFDKVAATDDGEDDQWSRALGNNPAYETETSASLLIEPGDDHPDTLTVYRGTAQRQAIEKAYRNTVAATGARTVLVDARSLSHGEVNSRIGAAGDTVMTPPLVSFLTTCFR